jgi:hypothetical protein
MLVSAWKFMNYKNEQLVKIGLDVVKNCDDFFAIQKLYSACQERITEISKNMVRSRMIGPEVEEDVF